MDSTPVSTQNSSDSGCISGTFETSHSFYESTPKDDAHGTPTMYGTSRKRKATNHIRRLADVIESYPSTPQFSSTLNESPETFKALSSVTNCLEDCHLFNSRKFYKDLNGKPKIPSEPCTPEKKDIRTPSSYSKCVESPRIEAQQLLYPNLKEVRGSPAPKLTRDSLLHSTAKKALFTIDNFYTIVQTPVVMANILQYLSNGDLYRFGMVAKCCLRAIEMNRVAKDRYMAYKEVYRVNKENYRITPPNSPEKEDTLSANTSENFNYFYNIGQKLKEEQKLQKCRKCGKACIVQHNIGQCEKCGFTCCLVCDSVSNSPDSFQDRCRGSQLVTKARNQFGDLSNSNLNDVIENSSFSLLNNSSRRCDSSGFGSDMEMTPTSVRKSLRFSEKTEKRVLTNNNRVVNARPVFERQSPVVPVIKTDNERRIEVIEPSSPPKVKVYAVCSKQSKRNLKRLTR